MNERESTPKSETIFKIDEDQVHKHPDQVVRTTVEETLNGLLEAEANELCKARPYERTNLRESTRAGHYEHTLGTRVGDVKLKMPKLPFCSP